MQLNHVLVGPNAGKTITLNGYKFVDGVLSVEVPDDKQDAQAGLTKYLAVNFNAHVEGSHNHKIAEAEWAANEANPDFKPAKAKAATNVLKKDKKEQEEEEEEEEEEEDDMTVADAVAKLDASNDDHWTSTGLPNVNAVEAILGRKTSRSEVEKESKGLKREDVNNA